MTGSELGDTPALVTGASRGFGHAIAVALHDAGANVVAVARTVPIMTWLVMPRVTRLLRRWLYPDHPAVISGALRP